MATKLNSEFNYRYLVQGETVWEKIKTLKGFLEGRVRAAALELVAEKKLQALRSELQHSRDIGALPHVVLRLEAELIELESHLPAQAEAFALNLEEVETLKRLLAEHFILAEPTRIAGYTDEQMFEANAANEFTTLLAREIHAEIIANGHPSPAKLKNAMSNPHTWNALIKAGLIPEGNHVLAGGDPLCIQVFLQPPALLAIPQHERLHDVHTR
jgi:hypothetical protein